LAGLVVVIINGLLAEDDQLGLFLVADTALRILAMASG
jgi:hypothetical protein